MKSVTIKTALAIAIAFSAAGCTKAVKPIEPAPLTSLEKELVASTSAATAALDSLALTERAIVGETNLDKIPAFDADVGPTDTLRNVKTIKFSGPIQNLVGKIAYDTGYKFSIIGKNPSVPVVVKVDVKKVQAVTILRSVSLQAGLRAKITLNPNEKLIELAFAN